MRERGTTSSKPAARARSRRSRIDVRVEASVLHAVEQRRRRASDSTDRRAVELAVRQVDDQHVGVRLGVGREPLAQLRCVADQLDLVAGRRQRSPARASRTAGRGTSASTRAIATAPAGGGTPRGPTAGAPIPA